MNLESEGMQVEEKLGQDSDKSKWPNLKRCDFARGESFPGDDWIENMWG
jgi:hypothetical protein